MIHSNNCKERYIEDLGIPGKIKIKQLVQHLVLGASIHTYMPLLSCLQQQLQQQRTFKQIVNKNRVIPGVKACDKSSRCRKLKVVRSVVCLVSISLWLFLFVNFVPGLSTFNTASCCVSIETPHLKRGAN